ncbi:MAG: helicase domain protein, partial [Chthonomonadales bacterium]|nr:helicase domain protein [Chthonomonadales bacterium]
MPDLTENDDIMPPDELIPASQPAKKRVLQASPGERALRDELQAMVQADLLGPAGGDHEEIGDEAQNVRDRYILGVLAPRHRVEKDESEPSDGELAQGGGGDGDDGSPDTGAPQKGTMFPSSLGMTFHVAGDAKAFNVTASWGRYERVKSEVLTTEKGDPKTVWRRIPVEATAKIALERGRLTPWSPCEECPEVMVQGMVRRKEGELDWTVTLFLVNGQKEPKESRDVAWLFQAGLAVEAPGKSPIFVKRVVHRSQGKLDEEMYRELKSLEMLYRCRAEFVVGHGVAVHAEPDTANPLRACRLETCALPITEVAAVEPASIPGLTLDMKELAKTTGENFAAALSPLVEAYADWIKTQKQRLAQGDDYLTGYRAIGADALARCEKAQERIQEGIALLASDPHASAAFRFANRAMWLQRIHTLYAEQIRQKIDVKLTDLDTAPNRTWRPFQLAFILLNLPGITGLDHPDRQTTPNATADLLWFPTGGGKTEAYLGLTAYTLAIRRLQGVVAGRSGEAGVAVLMRYTLRLLTLQQFQRATTLICACEAIRRETLDKGDATWGHRPFRIGLWVGNKTTPNTTEQAEQAVLERRDKKFLSGGTGDPAQLTYCPWCGSEINPGSHIKVDKARARTLIYCGDVTGRCTFSIARAPGEGLPVLVVDEEIYRQLPALLIATVDKFAQMPWNGVTQTLFGQVSGYCERHGFRSPDL